MNKSITAALIFFAALGVFGQTPETDSGPKVIVTDTMPPPQPVRTPSPKPVAIDTPAVQAQTAPKPVSVPTDGAAPASNLSSSGLSFSQIKSRLAEAKRQMQTRPLMTSMSEPMTMSVPVRIAYYDWNDKAVEYIVLTKEAFLTPNTPTNVLSSNGKPMSTRTIRANGVNTPVVITDMTGQAHLPLMVQYPVERGGRYYETAYYMSTHPGLVTPEVVNAGKFYVHNVIEIAREKLKTKGFVIQPKIADIAERLATVEHVDHLRFRTEYHPNIYNDIFTLFALNEGQTYRYSVSSAGAGGMVQMIPSTYRIVRSHFPGAALMPDFVEGMRDHTNAAQAMLLYMQMTWNDLSSRPTIINALLTGIATQEQLMAAGYNSNPAKLAGYINRGGPAWTSLIPKETQIYLRIYESLERAVPMTPRKM
jgi:hypothetical protein